MKRPKPRNGCGCVAGTGTGTTVIGITGNTGTGTVTTYGAETVDEFLKKNPYRAAIAIDTGETEKSYAVRQWPTYILIDRSGKAMPVTDQLSEEMIAKLVNAGSGARP